MKDSIRTTIIGIFVAGAVFAFLVFMGVIPLGGGDQRMKGKIIVWGTISYNKMQPFIDQARTKDIEVIYKVKDPETYDRDLVDAIAAGKGPDLFIMNHEGILRNVDKVYVLPYQSFPKEKYTANYIHESHLFLGKKGIFAFPLFVDPLVLFYNKQLINSSYLVGYPKTWDEFSHFVSKITVSDVYGGVRIAGTALGTFDNVDHAKDIVSMLFLQNGNPIVGDDPLNGKKKAVLSATKDFFEGAKNALTFYTSFRDQTNSHYTWNESFTRSRDHFVSGDLALYFGKMSEINDIRKKNPNLDFGVSVVPQLSDRFQKKTYGSLYGIAISKHSKKIQASILIASRLSGRKIVEGLTKSLFVAPARNDLLKTIPNDDILSVSYKSAIISDAWIDPDPKASNFVFRSVIRAINAKSNSLDELVRKMNADIQNILDETINKFIQGKY